MAHKTVSVIIPTYQPKAYLKECLDSLALQTFDRTQWELIIVLNGPKEPYYSDVVHLLSGYSFEYELLYSPVPGVSRARNMALDIAKGDYICFIDDDDRISPSYLRDLVDRADPSTVVVSNVLTFFDHTGACGKDYLSRAYDEFSRTRPRSLFHARKFLSSCCCKLIPKQTIGNKRFLSSFALGEDSLFMFYISDAIGRVVAADDTAVYYRRLRPDSASRSQRSFLSDFSNRCRLSAAYTKYYLSNPTSYNMMLYLSRMIAAIIRK